MLSMHTSFFLSSTCKELKPRSLCSLFDVFKCRMLNSWLQGCIDPIPRMHVTYAHVCLTYVYGYQWLKGQLWARFCTLVWSQCYQQAVLLTAYGRPQLTHGMDLMDTFLEGRCTSNEDALSNGDAGKSEQRAFFFLSWAQKMNSSNIHTEDRIL